MSPEQIIQNIGRSEAKAVAIGLPTFKNSSYLQAPLDGPAVLAGAVDREEGNPFTESGLDVTRADVFAYLGDLDLETDDEFERIRAVSAAAFRAGKRPIFLGGDHSVTYPLVAGMHDVLGPVTLLHFDAHPDLYDSLLDNPLSHACPFARIMENGFAKGLWQYGIRTLNPHQAEQVRRFGVHCNEMRHHRQWPMPQIDGPVYITIDLDALDPAFAPGVAHYEPGGMSVRDILDIVQSLDAPVVGADIVELNTARDIQGMTAIVAAKLLREVCGQMLAR
jgi:arginase